MSHNLKILDSDVPLGAGDIFFQFPGFQTSEQNVIWVHGPNGVGKTTFLRFLHSKKNLVNLNARPASTFLVDQMYEHLLFPYKPVWWNVMLPEIVNGMGKEVARSTAVDTINDFGIHVDPDRFPSSLSGGEKHLVVLTRLAFTEHEVLLLDEPTTGLDTKRITAFWDLLHALVIKRKKGAIIVTHTNPPGSVVGKSIEVQGPYSGTMSFAEWRLK